MKNRAGAASLLVLLVLLTVFWLGLQGYGTAVSAQKSARLEGQKIQAFYLAESGLAWARSALAENGSWTGGTRNFTGGQVKVTVKNVLGTKQLTALSAAGSAEVKLFMSLKKENEQWIILKKEVRND